MKQRKLIIVTISICILLGVIFLYKRPGINNIKLTGQTEYNTDIEENTLNTDIENNNLVEEDLPKTKQYIASYDELINSKKVSNKSTSNKNESEHKDKDAASIDAITSEDNINIVQQEVSSQLDDSKVVIIDESEKTMIDESIVNEYKGKEKTSNEFQFFDVEPSGEYTKENVEPNGVHVGKWN